jgi:hypothetical protein
VTVNLAADLLNWWNKYADADWPADAGTLENARRFFSV